MWKQKKTIARGSVCGWGLILKLQEMLINNKANKEEDFNSFFSLFCVWLRFCCCCKCSESIVFFFFGFVSFALLCFFKAEMKEWKMNCSSGFEGRNNVHKAQSKKLDCHHHHQQEFLQRIIEEVIEGRWNGIIDWSRSEPTKVCA